MMATNSGRPVPADAQVLVDLLGQYGLRGRYVERGNHPDESRRIQVRGEATLAPARIVTQIREAFKRGDATIPPILVTADGYIIAGNTRTRASKQAGQPSIRQIVVQVSWDGAPPAVKRQLIKLAVKSNIHGQQMTAAEKEAAVVAVYTEGDSPKRLAGETGIPVSTVSSVIAIIKARKRARDADVDISDESLVSRSVLRLLGKKMSKLNMEPWSQLLQLARDAALSVTEVNEIVNNLERLNTDGDKEELIRTERLAHDSRIRAARAGGRSSVKPSKPGKVRQHVGFFLNEVASFPADYAETDTRIWDAYLQDLYKTKETLVRLITEQLKVMESR